MKAFQCLHLPAALTVAVSLISCFATTGVEGWSCLPPSPAKKIKDISRKSFIVGAVGGLVLGTTATAAGAAVAIERNTASNKGPYEPPAGSLTDKVVLITGGSTGLGLESAKRLAAAGATIVLTARTTAKGEKSVEAVQSYLTEKGVTTGSKIFSLVLDLDDLESVKLFPQSYKKLGLGDIDVLMNNAGVMAVPDRQLTKDGFERTFQSNHLGHFALTAGLFPFLSRSKATIINVSSEAFQFTGGKFDLDNLNGEKKYGAWNSYGLSKLANIFFTQELQRRADESGDSSWLTAVTLHPGAVQTDLGRNIAGEEKYAKLKNNEITLSPLESFFLNTASKFILTVPQGASTQIYLAAGADGALQKGAFYEDLKVKNLPAFANDVAKAKQLWELSENLGGVQFKLEKQSQADTTPAPPSTDDSNVASS
mmetsp:Transcript_3262/g.7045  ORF Transcript_3262/g.7045 Transcript_3262/m.7045 type:complete len:425 (-) Transcript_3262:3100-4374(-)|eukprot:CAMPEP_0168197598 /NCGR_PEP_ID=MMETSP0139_2-20121125/21267_1 /TAXON_ID=44445 /ORGANISM="Pseudo-nitzschia australis, Strain 10249 10 AB" /LENGTH=424 /DNA_ID=CAMNT_0008122115 /DNA_START=132 /DNA_END=1406 /DNA_ORIENTATION=-